MDNDVVEYLNRIIHEHNMLQGYVYRLGEALRRRHASPLHRFVDWLYPLLLPMPERHWVPMLRQDSVVPMMSRSRRLDIVPEEDMSYTDPTDER